MNQSSEYRSLRIGLLTAAALVAAALFIVGITSRQKLFERKVEYFSYFPDAAGLKEGSGVWFQGVEVGFISSITFPKDTDSQNVIVTYKVSSGPRAAHPLGHPGVAAQPGTSRRQDPGPHHRPQQHRPAHHPAGSRDPHRQDGGPERPRARRAGCDHQHGGPFQEPQPAHRGLQQGRGRAPAPAERS